MHAESSVCPGVFKKHTANSPMVKGTNSWVFFEFKSLISELFPKLFLIASWC